MRDCRGEPGPDSDGFAVEGGGGEAAGKSSREPEDPVPCTAAAAVTCE